MDSLSETLLFSISANCTTELPDWSLGKKLDLLEEVQELILSDLNGGNFWLRQSRLKWALLGAGTLMADPSLIFPATIYPLGGKLSFPVASLLPGLPPLTLPAPLLLGSSDAASALAAAAAAAATSSATVVAVKVIA